jgi:hypothetical protein
MTNKKNSFFTGILSIALVFGFIGCPDGGDSGDSTDNGLPETPVITIKAGTVYYRYALNGGFRYKEVQITIRGNAAKRAVSYKLIRLNRQSGETDVVEENSTNYFSFDQRSSKQTTVYYQYWVYAVNANGESQESNVVTLEF